MKNPRVSVAVVAHNEAGNIYPFLSSVLHQVVHDLIQPFITDPHVLMCGGNPTPIAGRTFTEKAVNCTTLAFERFPQRVRGGNNVFSADGRLLAFRRELAQKIEIPSTMIANDMFAYFSCLAVEGEYRYVPTAVVYFRSPQTLTDHIPQNTRFLAARKRMEQYFPKHLVDDELHIPLSLSINILMKQFFRHPVLASYIFLVNRFCALRANLVEHTLDARWPLAQSTKLLYSNEHE